MQSNMGGGGPSEKNHRSVRWAQGTKGEREKEGIILREKTTDTFREDGYEKEGKDSNKEFGKAAKEND